jgi:hypothetical protein
MQMQKYSAATSVRRPLCECPEADKEQPIKIGQMVILVKQKFGYDY